MSRKTWQRIFSVLLMAGMLLSFVQPMRVSAGFDVPLADYGKSAPAAENALDKIEGQVLEEIQAEGATDFFVWMMEKADLSPAEDLKTKDEKGQFVFEALRTTAERTQKDLRDYLDKQGVEYQAFYIANKILVKAGNQTLVENLANRTDVAEITANHKYQLQEPFKNVVPEAPAAIESNITFVNADDVWAMGITGANVVLAGNDTGLDWDHPAIINKYRGWDGSVADHNYNWWDATGTYPMVPNDVHGHGTHTTGTMVGDDGAGNQIGMAPGAQTVHCKNMTDGGGGDDNTFTTCFQWDLAPWDLNGQNPLPEMAPDAINNSWGYWGGGAPQFEDEITALQAAGIAVEVSAGNEGSGCWSLRSPGDYDQVITTGSVNHAGGVLPGTLTGFSSRGPSSLYPDEEDIPDIMAPGENIRSSVPGGGYQGGWSGTSMAGPHTVGMIGLMWSANPALKGLVDITYGLINDTAVPLTGQNGSNCGGDYTEGPNNDWGYGTIDALAAVQAALLYGGAGTLQGNVYDSVSMAPLQYVDITADLNADMGWSDQTDEFGDYSMLVLAGTYTVTASLFGYIPQTVYGVVVTEDGITTQDFALVQAESGLVYGTVTDATTGWPLYAWIEIDGYPGGGFWTDPVTGDYEVLLPEGSSYDFHVSAYVDGYIPLDVTVGPVWGDMQQNFELEANLTACNAPGYETEVIFYEDFEADNGGFTTYGTNNTWEWGMPTSGPGAAHSGVNVWATNLEGYYNDYEDGYIESPNIDLSPYAGTGTQLNWWDWQQTETCCDYTQVQVSNNGGASWNVVYGPEYVGVQEWSEHTVFLDASYSVSNFRVRFYFHTDVSVTYPGWYVDDISIEGDCQVQDGGLVVGNVYEDNFDLPLEGAMVTNDYGEVTYTDVDGFYTLFSPPGDHLFTASMEDYNDEAVVVSVPAGGTVGQDFYLASGALAVDPTSLAVEIPMGSTDLVTMTIYNVGSGDAFFEISENDLGFVPLLSGNPQQEPAGASTDPQTFTSIPSTPVDMLDADVLLIQDSYAWGYAAMTTILDNNGILYDLILSSNIGAWDFSPYKMIIIPSSQGSTYYNNFNNNLAKFEEFIDEGGLMLMSFCTQGETINIPFGGYSVFNAQSYNYIVDPSYPIFAGVENPYYGNSASHTVPSELFEDDRVLVTTGSGPGGQAVMFERDAGSGMLVAGGQTFEHGWGNGYGAGTILANMIPYYYYNYQGGGDVPWLSVEPVSGTIPGNPINLVGGIDSLSGSFVAFDSSVGGDSSYEPYTSQTFCFRAESFTSDWEYVYNVWEKFPSDWTVSNVYLQGTPTCDTGYYGSFSWSYQDGNPYEINISHTRYQASTDHCVANYCFDVTSGAGGSFAPVSWYWDGDEYGGEPHGVCSLDGYTPTGQETCDEAVSPQAFVPWGENQPIQVTFDAGVAEVTQPGDYLAELTIDSDTPYDALTVPVVMTVIPPDSYGKLEGTVTGLGYCDADPGVLEEAVVNIEATGGMTWTLETDEFGYYSLWVDEAGTPFTIQVTYPEHEEGLATGVVVIGQGTTTVDFDLRWLQPCLGVDPDSMAVTLDLGASTTLPMTLTNSGAGDAFFEITDQEEAFIPALAGYTVSVDVLAGAATAPAGTAVAAGQYNARPESTYTIDQRAVPMAPPNVLLLNADIDNDGSSPIYDLLMAYGDLGVLELYDARYATPTLEELEAYDVVVTWANYVYQSPTGIGDVLADYVDGGGKVIDLVFGIDPNWGYQGRFRTEDYTAMKGSGTSYIQSCLGDYDPSHPVMEGVTDMCDLYRLWGTYLTPDSTAVANYTDGEIAVAVKDDVTVVTINAYPGYYYQWTGQLDLVLHNAIFYLSGGGDALWLTEVPSSGTIPGFWPLQGGTAIPPSPQAAPVPGAQLATSLQVANPSVAPLAPAIPEDVLWDQFNPSTTNFAAQDFEPAYDAYDIYGGDDFANADQWSIENIVTVGRWTNFVDLNNATAIHWYLYPDAGGEPAGVPGDGTEYWSLSLPPSDPQVDLGVSVPEDVVLTLDTPISLPPGNWWLVHFVSLEFGLYGQWGWTGTLDAVWGGYGSQNNPGGGFGLPAGWNPNTYNSDFSFTLNGTVIPGGENWQVIDVTFDAGMVGQPGEYLGTINVGSNDPVNDPIEVPVTMTVNAPDWYGKLEGTVIGLGYCDGEEIPLEEAQVVIQGGGYTYTTTTDVDGYYSWWLDEAFSPYEVTVTYPDHSTGTATVAIVGQQVTVQDFALRWLKPCIGVSPDSLEVTLEWGLSTVLPLNITNDGAAELSFEFSELNGGFNPALNFHIPRFEGELPVDTRPLSTDRAPVDPSAGEPEGASQILVPYASAAYALDVYPGFNLVHFPDADVPGTWDIVASVPQFQPGADFLNGDFTTLYAVDYDTNEFVAIDTATGVRTVIGYTSPSGSWTGLSGGPDGTLYGMSSACGSNSTLYTIDPDTGALTTVGNVGSGTCIIDIAINLDGEMYGVDIVSDALYQIDTSTGVGTYIGSTGVSANYAQGMDFDDDTGILYWAAYTFSGEMRVIDTETGNSVLVGAFPSGAEVDGLAFETGGGEIPWLFEDPEAGTVPPDGGELEADIIFDAGVPEIIQPGEYFGELKVKSNDPVEKSVTIPVTMTVLASPDLGKLEGTVTGLGYCDADPAPLEGAEVTVTGSGGGAWTLYTDEFGYYTMWINAPLQSPVTVAVAAADHESGEVTDIELGAGMTTTVNFDLRWLAPCVAVEPDAFEVTVGLGYTMLEEFELSNTGALATTFELAEQNGGFNPGLGVHIPRFEGELPVDTRPLSTDRAPADPSAGEPEGASQILVPYASSAYALDVYPGYNLVHFPDADVPGTWDIVASVPQFHPGADFLNGDFTTLYAVDYSTNEFVTIDTATGVRTVIGYTSPSGSWTGLSGGPDGTLFGMSSNCGVDSTLYTIDPDTGALTTVGNVGSGTCIIDIAINLDGEMYGVDIVSDALYQIDTSTGVGTYIGSTGVSANYAQGMDFDDDTGILYWAAYTFSGEMRVIDTETGNSVLVGAFPSGAEVDGLAFETGVCCGGDIPWLIPDPVTGTIEADSDFFVDLLFDTTVLTQTGDYTGTLEVKSDDPVYDSIEVPLLLHVVEPAFGVDLGGVYEGSGIPGEIVTYELVVTNMSNGPVDSFTVEVGTSVFPALPDVTEVGPLDAGESATFHVAVEIPVSAMGGESDAVDVTVTSVGDNTQSDTATLVTTVTGTYGVMLTADQTEGTGYPGGMVAYTVHLMNSGTLQDTITLEALDVEPGWEVHLDEDSYDLAGGASVDITFHVLVPVGAETGDWDIFRLQAVSSHDPTKWNEVEFTTTVSLPQIYLPFINKP